MKTFEEWWDKEGQYCAPQEDFYQAAEDGWQACDAEHQAEHKLVANLRARVDASERKIASLESRLDEEKNQRQRQIVNSTLRIGELKSRLDEVRKLAEKWNSGPITVEDCAHCIADELLVILDRKAGSQ